MKTTYQDLIEKFVFKDAHGALDPVCKDLVSKSRNAVYKAHDFTDAAMAVAAENGFVGAVMENMRDVDRIAEVHVQRWKDMDDGVRSAPKRVRKAPTSQWFLGLLRPRPKSELLEKGTDMMEASIELARKMGLRPKRATCGVDLTFIPCHAKMNDELVRSKPKGGTSKMEAYLTVHIADGIHLTTTAFPYTRNDSIADLLRNAIRKTRKQGIVIRKLLLDRGFYSVEVLRVLREEKVPYIMAIRKTGPVKEKVVAYHEGRGKAVMSHTVSSEKGTEDITMLVHERCDADEHEAPVDKYIVLAFAGFCKSDKAVLSVIPEEYRKRWAIETGYRNIKNMRAKTRSMSPGVRWFLYLFSVALSNFWALANAAISDAGTKIIVPAITIAVFAHCLYRKIVVEMAARCLQRAGPDPPT